MTGPRQREVLAREDARLAPGASEESALGRLGLRRGQGRHPHRPGRQPVHRPRGRRPDPVARAQPTRRSSRPSPTRPLGCGTSTTSPPPAGRRCASARRAAARGPGHLRVLLHRGRGRRGGAADVQAVAEPGRNRIGRCGTASTARPRARGRSCTGTSATRRSPGTACWATPFTATAARSNSTTPPAGCAARPWSGHIAEKPNMSALVFEPVLGAAGVIVPPPGYWEQIADSCREHGCCWWPTRCSPAADGPAPSWPASSSASNRTSSPSPRAWPPASPSPCWPDAPACCATRTRPGPVPPPPRTPATRWASRWPGPPWRSSAATPSSSGSACSARWSTSGSPTCARYEVLGEVRGLGLLHGLEFVRDRITREPAPNRPRRLPGGARPRAATALGGQSCVSPLRSPSTPLLEEGIARLDQALEQATEGGR